MLTSTTLCASVGDYDLGEDARSMTEDLEYELEEAREQWELAARAERLHVELANLYHNKSRDTRTINRLWQLIEEIEYELRYRGVRL